MMEAEDKIQEAISYLSNDDLCAYQNNKSLLDNINGLDSDGRSLLFHAVLSENQNFVSFLLENNANPDLKDNLGWTALHYAVDNFLPDITNTIIKYGGDIEARDDYGNNVIWRAVFSSRGRGEIIELLLKNGANYKIKNDLGTSAYMLAERIGNYNVRQYFTDET